MLDIYNTVIEDICLGISGWWFFSCLLFFFSSRIRDIWDPDVVQNDDMNQRRLMKYCHFLRTAFISCILFATVWLFIVRRGWNSNLYGRDCSTARMGTLLFVFASAIKFFHEYLRCEVLFKIVNMGPRVKMVKTMVLVYGLVTNLSFMTMMIVLQFVFKDDVTGDRICNVITGTQEQEKLTHIILWLIATYIFINEVSTLYLFVYPLWCVYQDYRKQIMAKWKDLNMIKNLAVRSIMLSIPVPLFMSVYIIVGRMSYDLTWHTDRPYIVFLFAGLFQYIAMSLKYNYWRYILGPCMLISRKHPFKKLDSSYERLQGDDSRKFSQATGSSQSRATEGHVKKQCKAPRNRFSIYAYSYDGRTIAHRERVCHYLRDPNRSYRRSSSYLDVSPNILSGRTIRRSMVMNDSGRLVSLEWNQNVRKLETPVERRGVTFKWFVNWARHNILLQKQANSELKEMSTRDFVKLFVKTRIQTEGTQVLWPLIPEDETGPPHIFVSHAWDMQVQDLIEALRDWRKEYFEKKWGTFYWLPMNLDLHKEPRIWLDILALPQDDSADSAQLIETFTRTITAIGKVVLCVDVDFKPLKRSWCLYELAMASKFDFAYHVGMSFEFSKLDQDYVKEKVTRIDVKMAEAQKKSDKDMIDEEIKARFGSLEELNKRIEDIFKPRINEWKAAIAGICELPETKWRCSAIN